jgi:RsmE family RNA methyltransferase
MNSLIILQSELVDQEKALLQGERARYAFSTHGLSVGRVVRVGVLGGRRGSATVINASPHVVELSVKFSEEPLARRPIDLVVGLSRPQTVKKTIQAAVMLGVRSLRFVQSERGEKSYRDSHALTQESIQSETIKALEQIWDSNPPEITVHHSARSLLTRSLLPSSLQPNVIALVAQPQAVELVNCSDRFQRRSEVQAAPSVVVAIGPEAGWSTTEVQTFIDNGYMPVGLGERVLRVEVALIYLLGQLDVLLLRSHDA